MAMTIPALSASPLLFCAFVSVCFYHANAPSGARSFSQSVRDNLGVNFQGQGGPKLSQGNTDGPLGRCIFSLKRSREAFFAAAGAATGCLPARSTPPQIELARRQACGGSHRRKNASRGRFEGKASLPGGPSVLVRSPGALITVPRGTINKSLGVQREELSLIHI